jgi:hypothetical protein
MKYKILILLSLFLLSSNFCKKDNSENNFGLDCDKLIHGIYNANIYPHESNDSLIKVEIDKLTKDLTPKPNVSDYDGQLANLYTLFTRLEKCGNISFYICCYSCIQTGPPQSEVSVCVDSSGIQICRIFDFYTWEHDNLTFAAAHDGPCNK